MLKILRKKENAKKVLWLLAIIIVPAFVLWGSASILRNQGKENYAGKIFGRKISFEEFNRGLQAVQTQAIMQFGDNFYKVQKFLNLKLETWDRLILLHEARKYKIKVTDNEVTEAIKKYPFFQRNGKFDLRIYEDVLSYVFHLPARIFEEQIRETVIFAKLFNEVTKNTTLDDSELLNEYKKANEKIKVSYLLSSPQKFEKDISIEETTLKDYFEKHQQDFKKPPSINIQYLGIDFPQKIDPQEKRQIQDKINQISETLANDPNFEKAALKFSLSIRETGFFSRAGPIPAIGWSNEFWETVFSLKPQEISKPLETPKGIYILRSKEKKDSYIPVFGEVETEIKKILSSKKALELAEDKAKQALEKIRTIYKTSKKINFTKLSQFFSLETQTTPLFKYGEYIPNIGIAKEFQDAAFKLKDSKDKVSGIISLPTGFCILKLEGNQEIDEKKFIQEKEEFKKAQLDKKKKEAFNSFFEKLKLEAHLKNNIPP